MTKKILIIPKLKPFFREFLTFWVNLNFLNPLPHAPNFFILRQLSLKITHKDYKEGQSNTLTLVLAV